MRILIAFSDTGGGHRAAARQLQTALLRHAPAATVRMVDPYALSDRWPFSHLHAAYPTVVGHAPWLWSAGFRATNSPLVTAVAQAMAWPVLRPAFRALRTPALPDLIISTHPLLASPLRRAFPATPIVVVVTDLVSGHVSWYDRVADLIVVPTATAYAQALASGVHAEQLVEAGIPVDPAFVSAPSDIGIDARAALASQLGWRTDRPTVLLMGGGDGIGPLDALATAIDDARLSCDLAIVAGRNASLATRLRSHRWRGRVHVYDFVQELGLMMRAASALITKAGPGTISEAFAAACPLILFGAIPGQETGNVRLVCESGSGVWAPTASAVISALREWVHGAQAEHRRLRASLAARAAARPWAAEEITRVALALAGARPLDERRPDRWPGEHRGDRGPRPLGGELSARAGLERCADPESHGGIIKGPQTRKISHERLVAEPAERLDVGASR